MHSKHSVALFVGSSGCGKDTVANALEAKDYTVLKSYTTRKPRYENEPTHIFITEPEGFDFLSSTKYDIIAYTEYDNHVYFSTQPQLLKSDIYIVNPEGVVYLKNKINHDLIDVIVIGFEVPVNETIERMQKRGDSLAQIEKRLETDAIHFAIPIHYDYIIKNDDLVQTVEKIEMILKLHKIGQRNKE